MLRRFLIFPLKLAAFLLGVLFAAWLIYVDWSNPDWTGKQTLIYAITGVKP